MESFNGKFRDECLGEHGFADIPHAGRIIEALRVDYNEVHPHSALGNVPRVWDADDILDALKAGLQEDQVSFLRVLVNALNDPACMESLEGNTIWTRQSSVPLEAPWPELGIEP